MIDVVHKIFVFFKSDFLGTSSKSMFEAVYFNSKFNTFLWITHNMSAFVCACI